MSQYTDLKTAINAAIKQNNNQEITGPILNRVLNAMVNSLGANYQLAGVATPSTNPGTPDQNVFYLAFEAGTYVNFGNIELPAGISMLCWNGSWTSQTWFVVDDEPVAGSRNLVESGGVANNVEIYHFVGNGNTFSLSKCCKIIPGHTYRVCPVAKTWPWATTQSGAIVFEIRYKDGEGSYKTAYQIRYGSGNPSIPDYVDAVIPVSNVEENGNLYVGGRTTPGGKVYFTIEDITYAKENIERIDHLTEDYNIIKDAVTKTCYEENYADGYRVNAVFNIVSDNDYFLSDFIPCNEGDVIRWIFSSGTSVNAALSCYDEDKNSLNAGWANQGGTGERTVTNTKTGCKYIRVSFLKESGYVPSVYINNELVWIKKEKGQVEINTEDIAELKERVSDVEGTAEIVKQWDSKQNYIENKYINTAGNIRSLEGYFISNHIPAKKGDVVKWDMGPSLGTGVALNEYDENGDKLGHWSNTGASTSGTRTITIAKETTAYIVCSFIPNETFEHKVYVNGELVWTKQEDGEILKLEQRVTVLEDKVSPSDTTHGVIGENYPEQMDDIDNKLSYRFANRFHFLHLSDNHNSTYAHAEEFLDLCPAKFLINTGDLVADKFTDSKANTIAYSIAPDKPVYLVLGNHDYSHAPSKQAVYDAFFGDAETEGTINYHNSQAGGVVATKSYYNADFVTEGIKCIMLDMNDNQSDSDLPDLGPTAATYGAMSQEQIEWFVAQLQDAAANGLHVCAFIHALPTREKPHVFAKVVDSFLDTNYAGMNVNGLSTTTCYRLSFLLDIVDAFINGSSAEFTYNNYEYNFTFATAGHFVAWFAGHQHQDCAGWLTGHENQFAINVCRPTKDSGNALGTYDGDRLGVHFNYVTIDKGMKSLSVYRVGQQSTVYATERKSFRIIYI